MRIENDLLQGERVGQVGSPNHGGHFNPGQPDTIVIHYTAGSSAESSVQTLCNPDVKASAHVVVARDGAITQLVPFNTIAWHAGRSSYGGRTGLNRYSIGIELDNAGRLTKGPSGYTAWFGRSYPEKDVVEAVHRNESKPTFWQGYTEIQIETTLSLCYRLADAYPIKDILGHEEIAPYRKTDPGPAFPLEKTRERVLERSRNVEEPADYAPMGMSGLVQAENLNIRSGPGLRAAKAGPPLARGTVVEILNETNGWYEVEVKKRGWVKKEYVRT